MLSCFCFVSFKICLTYTRGTIYNLKEAVSMIKQNCQCIKYFPRSLSHWWYILYALSWEKGQYCFPWISALKVISYIESNIVTSYEWIFFCQFMSWLNHFVYKGITHDFLLGFHSCAKFTQIFTFQFDVTSDILFQLYIDNTPCKLLIWSWKETAFVTVKHKTKFCAFPLTSSLFLSSP